MSTTVKAMRPRTLAELPGSDAFPSRHIGPTPAERDRMLQALGRRTLADLVDSAVPGGLRASRPLDLPEGIGEAAALAELRALADRNQVLISLIGMGYSGTFTPPVLLRNVLENPAWYTSYTPYQAEISQGRLEALLNFQTMVADLTGLEIANASLLDEASAAAEAMQMCHRIHKGKSATVFVVDRACHPQVIEVVETRAEALGIELEVGDPMTADMGRAFGVLVQYPGTHGVIPDLASICSRAQEGGALVVAAADLLALTLIKSPGELGVDVAVGSAQRFGIPLWYGGPHAAYIACRQAHQRQLPGRLVGVSVDGEGRPALRLALQTREQHIRRESATSNICTAQALLAVVAGLYAAYHGPDGLRAIAERVHRLATILATGLSRGGDAVGTGPFFDTVAVHPRLPVANVLEAARERRLNLRSLDSGRIGISLDETTTPAVVEAVWAAFGVEDLEVSALDAVVDSPLPDEWLRTSDYLTHPVFNRYRSETEMLRYLRQLADRDLALDRTMIPLGSCTMKLNAAAEMIPISWPGFAELHPYVPLEQAGGYRQLINDLERWLAEIGGFEAISLQPNAGSQGEYAGLLAVRRYHASRGEGSRNVCLIPTSAHGTNAASAAMAGLRVVPVATDSAGNVDLADLRSKVSEHGPALAGIMVTYPSTRGIYEASLSEICALVHEHGGQVYIDGANLNALVGLVRLGEIGGDVCHFNLHKTFCIPHGGGGPGVGPIGVRAHLAPFLPGNGVLPAALAGAGGGAVAGSPWGSAGVLPITWAYLRMMGPEGLVEATGTAVLAANYIAQRLEQQFPILHRGAGGHVAHECILDLRALTAATGVTAEDVAKRLIDFGFHAPTMSFPVAGTLMVEPTESESLRELDRFCEAMIAIRAEIAAVETGHLNVEESPLRHAPHTATMVAAATWERRYSRQQAAFPVPSMRDRKYWPPVSRIDNAYGDRHPFCTCPPLEAEPPPPV